MPTQKKISVIIPVYRESDKDLEALLSWMEENSSSCVEWIIASPVGDGVHSLGRNYVGSTSFVTCPLGRASQMNAGFHHSTGQLIVFLHADTRLSTGWQEELRGYVESKGERAWGCFSPQINAKGFIYRLAENWGTFRTKVLGIPFGDQTIFITAPLFRDIGCYDESVDFMEELAMAKELRKRRLAPEVLRCRALTSSRQWQRHGALFYSMRNLLLFFLFLAGVSRSQLKRLCK